MMSKSVQSMSLVLSFYKEISIALDSKHGLCAMQSRRLTRGDTDLDRCANSTICKYTPHMHGRSQIVISAWDDASSVFLVYWTSV